MALFNRKSARRIYALGWDGETMGRDGEKVKIHKLEELRGPTGT